MAGPELPASDGQTDPGATPTAVAASDASQPAGVASTSEATTAATPVPTARPYTIPDGPQLHVPLRSIPLLDPGLANDSDSIAMLRNLFEGLLVADEDAKRPLTDQAIVNILKESGVQIARRTVAKYRDQLGVLSARMRKRV